MTRTTLATALVPALFLALAVPAAAQSLTVLLPSISFPEPVTTPSSTTCTTDSAAPVCALSR